MAGNQIKGRAVDGAMIAGSRLAKLGAVATAFFVHGALAMVVMPGDEIKIEGGAGAPEARLGTSFADMVAGTLEAEEAFDTVEPLQAESAAKRLETESAKHTDSVQPVQPAEAMPAPPPAEAITPDIPAIELANPAPQPQETTPAPIKELLKAEPSFAVSQSLRPKPRGDRFEAHEQAPAQPVAKGRATPKDQAAPKPKAQPARRGNAEQNAVAGATIGSASAKAGASGAAAAQAQAAGNAAVSNYPGLVMRKIMRVPRPRVGSRGTAVVGFSIGGGGGLANVHLAVSSGSAQLDQAALRMVHAAAPFPAPPPGAQRSFTINIKGR